MSVLHKYLYLQVLSMAHWAAVPSAKLAELHSKRAEVLRANSQHAAAFMDVLHAAEVLL